MRRFKTGDYVIYYTTKWSTKPTLRAEEVQPNPKGEGYRYKVKKFWVVDDANESQVHVRTRRGKNRLISTDDPCLRKARWWERLLWGHRFPLDRETLNEIGEQANDESGLISR